MLDLRPSCEHCDCDLSPESRDAMICSFECTFCSTCVDEVLKGVCSNCGGNFVPRPIRPAKEWREGVSLARFPASTKRVHKPKDPAEQTAFAASVATVAPENR
ncbi:DUF1272 domain-containing protein [Kordiimonas gwangyangensis]|uniref:DUF1272 domain-containing protein n=1 Tax=Kordiimonas gwangyangensis TaxID=288022 RepID=UPI00036F650B|nr:DUF1272 domain-containing protein [Kordiimonas gwangyangensis]